MANHNSTSPPGHRAAWVALLCVIGFVVCQGIVLQVRSMVRSPDMALGYAMDPLLFLVFFLRIPLGVGAVVSAAVWGIVRLRARFRR